MKMAEVNYKHTRERIMIIMVMVTHRLRVCGERKQNNFVGMVGQGLNHTSFNLFVSSKAQHTPALPPTIILVSRPSPKNYSVA